MPVFGDLALFPSIKKIYQKYFPNLDLSSGDYKEFNLERDKLPPEEQQAFMTELLADPMVQGAMNAPKSTVSVGSRRSSFKYWGFSSRRNTSRRKNSRK